MKVIEQIRKMPLPQKLLTMEALWEELAISEENVEIPEWHKDYWIRESNCSQKGKPTSLIGNKQRKKSGSRPDED